ncbi:unnamed protein product [Ilex paraguariensis]|uniref:Uncharacterized protein n=1 Tax=Ilex paraguariensis TaxID=185542 RepID=A0ABC8U0V2_9AQUA
MNNKAAGVRTQIKVPLGAWSWDTASGEEFRVGAGLAEPYAITWCAVEYFEASGAIFQMLLQHISPNNLHYGRSLLHHAILCGNTGATKVLLNCGTDIESPVKTSEKTEFRPIHMAARLGLSTILQCLIDSGCDLNATTNTGETALTICAKYKQADCLRVLATAGADFGLVNIAGQSASSIAGSNRWCLGFQQAVLNLIRVGKVPKSSNISVFSPLMFAARSGDVQALRALIEQGEINLDSQDDKGFSAVMVTAMEGHVEAFRLLVYEGADVKLSNKLGKTAITLSKLNQNHDQFEKVLLEFALEKGSQCARGFYALHYAARRGDLNAVKLLTSRGYDVNVADGDGNTPLMLAAREGHGSVCKLLISSGARCDVKNAKEAHQGREGAPHKKFLKMLGNEGVLQWGRSSRRNVICGDAEVGPSSGFRRFRQRKGDGDVPGLFRVVTTNKKEFHFVCQGGLETAELWVRGIKLVTREGMFGKMESGP